MLSSETNLAEFAQHVRDYPKRLQVELVDTGREMAEEGKALARQALDMLVYGQPERGYTRTGSLRRSVYGYPESTQYGLGIVLGAAGGANGRSYAAYVDQGTYGSRIERDRLLADARGDGSFTPRAYSRGESGMEARAFMEAAVAELERQAPDWLFEAQERAWG